MLTYVVYNNSNDNGQILHQTPAGLTGCVGGVYPLIFPKWKNTAREI